MPTPVCKTSPIYLQIITLIVYLNCLKLCNVCTLSCLSSLRRDLLIINREHPFKSYGPDFNLNLMEELNTKIF